MKKIPLTRGLVALVDDEDFECLAKYKWHVYKAPLGKFYAARKEKVGVNRWTTRYMARQIMGFPDCIVDHVDPDDTLNNTRANLRLADHSENKINVKLRKDNTTGYKGVSWHKGARKWIANLGIRGKDLYLGLFATAEEAAQAYDRAVIEHYGEFARTNPEC